MLMALVFIKLLIYQGLEILIENVPLNILPLFNWFKKIYITGQFKPEMWSCYHLNRYDYMNTHVQQTVVKVGIRKIPRCQIKNILV